MSVKCCPAWCAWLALAVGLAVLLPQFLFPIQDGDYYWHLRSGQYLVEEQALPAADPFSFTTPETFASERDARRSEVLLTQYWLGQVVLYGIYQVAGETGAVLLRAVAFGGLLLGLYLAGRRDGPWTALALLLLAGSLLTNFPTERPQLFTFLLMPVVLLLLETLRTGPDRPGPAHWALPLAMLAWANLHGGFLLGAGLCVIYLGDELLAGLRQRRPLRRPLLVSLAAALAAASLNPNGYNALLVWLTADPEYIKGIYENLSPFYVWQFGYYYPAFWTCVAVALVSLVCGWRRLPLAPLLVLVALAVLGMTSLRYMPFLGLALLVLLPKQRVLPGLALWATLAAGVVLAGADARMPALAGVDARTFPVATLDRLVEADVATRIFSLYDWGGYVGFRLPRSEVFIDGRGLVASVSELYEQVMAGQGWQAILDRYRVDLVVVPGVEWYAGTAPVLVGLLAEAPGWTLVHWDEVALVFARTGSAVAAPFPALAKTEVFRHQLVRSRWLEERGEVQREPLLQTRTIAQVKLGDLTGALETCRQLLELNPDNRFARQTLPFLQMRLGAGTPPAGSP